MVLWRAQTLESLSADPLWELERCRIQWFCGEPKLIEHVPYVPTPNRTIYTFPRTFRWNVLEFAIFTFPRTIGWNVLECAIFTFPRTIGWNLLECANFTFPRTIRWNVLECANFTFPRTIGWSVLWELEACEIQWFEHRSDFGATHCRSSLGAGSM